MGEAQGGDAEWKGGMVACVPIVEPEVVKEVPVWRGAAATCAETKGVFDKHHKKKNTKVRAYLPKISILLSSVTTADAPDLP